MTNLTGISFPLTGDDIIDASTQGSVWNLSATNVVHWTLANGFLGESWADPDFAVAKIADALSTIEAYVNIDFQYGGYFTDPITAGQFGSDLVYSLYGDNRYGAEPIWAVGFFPNYNYCPVPGHPLGWATQAGDIFLNANHKVNTQTSFEPGSAGFSLILHETFHALGLKHTHDDGGSGRPTLAQLGIGEFNQDWFSVMSYSDQHDIEKNKWDPATPMLLDVLALQYLYGANLATNAGDTTHTISETGFYSTIWDAGGSDLVDLSQLQEGWKITLPNTKLSTLLSTMAGVALPVAQLAEGETEVPAPTSLLWLTGDIENVLGTAFGDEIVGNHLNNSLNGAAGADSLYGEQGNDLLDGGDGVDTGHYSGNQTSYTLTLSPTSAAITDRRADGNGTDQLVDMEFLDFETDLLGAPFDLAKFAGPSGLSAEQLESFIELYIAYFNRAPDAVGLFFWGTAFANGFTLEQMATAFIDQDETRATYPDTLTNADFATAVYGNVLGRIPDPLGFEFWVNVLNGGWLGRDQFILSVLGGAKADPPDGMPPEFITQQLADRQFLADKTDIGAYFAVHKGMSDVGNASSAMALFDGTESSVTNAVNAINGFYADALDPTDGEFLMQLVGVLDDPFAIA